MRGGELDGERYAVQGHADLPDGDDVLRCELEVGLRGSHARDEEIDGRIGGIDLDGGLALEVGQGERPDLHPVLP